MFPTVDRGISKGVDIIMNDSKNTVFSALFPKSILFDHQTQIQPETPLIVQNEFNLNEIPFQKGTEPSKIVANQDLLCVLFPSYFQVFKAENLEKALIVVELDETETTSAAFSFLNRYLSVGCSTGVVLVIELYSEERNWLVAHKNRVNSVSHSPKDSVLLASASHDNTVRLWNVESCTQLAILNSPEGHCAPVRAVSFSPDGELVASCSVDRTVRLWKTQEYSGKLKIQSDCFHSVYNLLGEECLDVCFNGNFVVCLTEKGVLQYFPTFKGIESYLIVDYFKEQTDYIFAGEGLIFVAKPEVLMVFKANGEKDRAPEYISVVSAKSIALLNGTFIVLSKENKLYSI